MPKLLLCDDDIHILRAAEFKLKRAGYHVRTASDGEEAWESMQVEMPDLLITDYQMPRLDGLQLIARCRDASHLAELPILVLTARLPILMLTAKGLELDQTALMATYKLSGILSKPFSPRELQSRVTQIVGPATVAGPKDPEALGASS
jgi:DNA-binding response OmpR family regulator